jgi:hypothetical protein
VAFRGTGMSNKRSSLHGRGYHGVDQSKDDQRELHASKSIRDRCNGKCEKEASNKDPWGGQIDPHTSIIPWGTYIETNDEQKRLNRCRREVAGCKQGSTIFVCHRWIMTADGSCFSLQPRSDLSENHDRPARGLRLHLTLFAPTTSALLDVKYCLNSAPSVLIVIRLMPPLSGRTSGNCFSW